MTYQCGDVEQLRCRRRSVARVLKGWDGAILHLGGCGAIGVVEWVAGVFFRFLGGCVGKEE